MKKVSKLENLVQTSLKNNDLTELVHFSKIQKSWPVIVSDQLAKKTAPKKIEKKILIIQVEDAAYAHNLKFYTKNILAYISVICGENVIRGVRFHVGSLPERLQNPPQEEVKKKLPVKRIKKSEIPAAVSETSAPIKNKKLRECFNRMMAQRQKAKE